MNRPRQFFALLALGLTTLGVSWAVSVQPVHCGQDVAVPVPQAVLPEIVTGRVGFYAAAYRKGIRVSSVALGDPTAVFPTASIFKTLVVHAVMRAVDAGKLRLEQPFTTTAANRSIEAYPRGTHSLRELIERAIRDSDNTASDILHLTVGPKALAREIKAKSPCTTVLLTTKAWWAAQAGLASDILGSDLLSGARAYAEQPFDQRLETAVLLNAAARQVTAPAVEDALDAYFHGPDYTPDLELWLQNTTTAAAYTDLIVGVLPALDLRSRTRKLFRTIMREGCCIPKDMPIRAVYRAAKAGSGWRILTLTGYLELPDGLTLAYTYLNDCSDTLDAEEMEQQIRPINAWIDQVLLELIERSK
jgi:hypothetical protein